MTIQIDSREKPHAIRRIVSYFDQNGIDHFTAKLNVGDYVNPANPHVAIDRKQNLDELCSNLISDDRGRFWREIRRAKADGVKLYILCEHGGGIKSIPDVARWRSKYSPFSGRELMERIYKVHISYGVEFLFCDKRRTGKRIFELCTK